MAKHAPNAKYNRFACWYRYLRCGNVTNCFSFFTLFKLYFTRIFTLITSTILHYFYPKNKYHSNKSLDIRSDGLLYTFLKYFATPHWSKIQTNTLVTLLWYAKIFPYVIFIIFDRNLRDRLKGAGWNSFHVHEVFGRVV